MLYFTYKGRIVNEGKRNNTRIFHQLFDSLEVPAPPRNYDLEGENKDNV